MYAFGLTRKRKALRHVGKAVYYSVCRTHISLLKTEQGDYRGTMGVNSYLRLLPDSVASAI